MTLAHEEATNLRKLAEDCRTMAAIAKTPEIRIELTEMAERFARLAATAPVQRASMFLRRCPEPPIAKLTRNGS